MEEGAVQSPKSNMRRKWPHLGAVETIYEEESEHDQEQDDDDDDDDEDCTDSTPSDSIITSPPTSLHSAVKAWTMAKERETDVAIHVQGSCFCLHKEPLTSKSSYLKRLLKESCRITVSPPLNITAKTFELIADYCYTGAIVITPVNVASLRIAAELLEMSNVDDGATKGENLRQKTETYFRRAIAVNKEYASIVLRSCLSQMPEAETSANLVSKCIEALALVDDRDNVVDYLQDIKTVHCEDFRLIAESLYKKLTRTEGQDLLYRIVDLYFKEYTGNITDEQKMGICNYIDCNILSPQLLVHAVQNPRLPLRFVVQAMFIEQLNTRRTVISAANNHEIKRTYYESPESDTLGALLQRDAALRQVAQLKSAMDATSSRIQSLEKELSVMRQVVQDSSVVASSQIDSGRSASFRLDLERKVGRGQAGSASALSYRSFRRKERKISDEEQSWGDSSSITKAEQKNLGRRLMNGLKSAFGVGTSNKKNTSQTSGGSKVDGGIGREGEYKNLEILM
ncbi:hypothetical protein DCAR_0729646 [Daucus carota subsp. sativus]|uniref:BTB domain-containing protein n=1 Tax=Daucus carota subsp. sativus TaxID=79200 RepID=A0AAF0XLD7_DAUCS|nr:PREDICTED: BTB/POZ domain-containing protein At3g49900 [Daucus carota subsp. sativus]WOH10183.1 hypothetical protein DCAR_0729646 [Daucus carota subsp. sativus]